MEMSGKKEYAIPGSSYVLVPMNPDHTKAVADVLYEGFSTPTEPVWTFINVPKDVFYAFMIPYIEMKIKDDISFVATDPRNDNEVVAVFLHEDFGFALRGDEAPEYIKKLEEKSQELRITGDVFRGMKKKVLSIAKELNYSKVLHLFAWAVAKKARGNRITQHMMKIMMELTKEKGYELMFVMCTNYFSDSVISKHYHDVFNLSFEVIYDDYVFHETQSKPYLGCNEASLKYLKDNGLYKEKFGDKVAYRATLHTCVMSQKKLK